jgi:hypothetical protein
VYSCVERGLRVADIGCDHGLLALALAHNQRSPTCIASDRLPSALQVAQRNIQLAGEGARVCARLGDGLQVLQPGEVDAVAIAGMGLHSMRRQVCVQHACATAHTHTDVRRSVLSQQRHARMSYADAASASLAPLRALGVRQVVLQPYPMAVMPALCVRHMFARAGWTLQHELVDQHRGFLYLTASFVDTNTAHADEDGTIRYAACPRIQARM